LRIKNKNGHIISVKTIFVSVMFNSISIFYTILGKKYRITYIHVLNLIYCLIYLL
ncbi:hypothetical protein ACJX0J_037017, partial [Zea mays]